MGWGCHAHPQDIVPHLPPEALGFRHCPTEVFYQVCAWVAATARSWQLVVNACCPTWRRVFNCSRERAWETLS